MALATPPLSYPPGAAPAFVPRARAGLAAPRAWVQFLAVRGPGDPPFVGSLVDGGLWRYQLDDVRSIRGAAPSNLAAGWRITRVESRGPMRRPACEICFEGVTEHLGYTTAEQQRTLQADAPPPGAPVAVLVLLSKNEAWWRLAQDERQRLFNGDGAGAGHLAHAATAPRLPLHRLYHARYTPGSEWDFMVLFELAEHEVPTLNHLLESMRDRRNGEWQYVEREAELWMRQQPRRP